MKILATIGKYIVKAAKFIVNVLTNSPLTELVATSTLTVASCIITYKIVSVGVRKMIRRFKKRNKAGDGSVMDVAKKSTDVKEAVKESLNRDQDIDQNIRLHGYTEKELDAGMKKMIREVNIEDGIINTGEEKEVYDPESRWYYQYDEHRRNIIFYHRITPEQPYEFCEKLFKKLYSNGFIKGPWNANPHRRAIEERYGQ